MVVWRVIGSEIGPNGNGAAHFATKAEALEFQRECRDGMENPSFISGPEKIVVRSRQELAAALDEAMGYGVT